MNPQAELRKVRDLIASVHMRRALHREDNHTLYSLMQEEERLENQIKRRSDR